MKISEKIENLGLFCSLFEETYCVRCRTAGEAIFVLDFFSTSLEDKKTIKEYKTIYNTYKDRTIIINDVDEFETYGWMSEVKLKTKAAKKYREVLMTFDKFVDLIKIRVESSPDKELYQSLLDDFSTRYDLNNLDLEYYLKDDTKKVIDQSTSATETTETTETTEPLLVTETKTCSKCGIQKPYSEFFKRSKGSKDGYTGICKACSKK